MAAYNVLIPLDGSRLAEASMAYLSGLRRMGDLHVTLISAVDEAMAGEAGQDGIKEKNLLHSYLAETSKEVGGRLGIPIETKIVSGNPAVSILEAAGAAPPDLLIITTHGRSGINRWRLGSVADKVIRAAECSVLTIGPHVLGRADWRAYENSGIFHRLLLPLDGSALAEAAIPTVLRIATTFGSELHLVRAVPIPMMGDAYVTELGSTIDLLMSGAGAYLTTLTERPGLESAKTTHVLGYPSDVLQAYVGEHGIDLVVMSSHGRSGVTRAALGSVTDRMIGSTAPVLVVRATEPGV